MVKVRLVISWLIAFIALVALAAQLHAQAEGPASTSITPYTTLGIRGSSNMGYDAPSMLVQSGVEYDRGRVLSLSQGSFSPGVKKNGMTGYSAGFSTRNYVKVNRYLAAGGGFEYVFLSTPVWSKSSVWVSAEAAFPVSTSRVFVDYLYPVYEHNRVHSLRASVEVGHGRLRPIFGVGVVKYSEPYDCTVCAVETGGTLEVGVKVILGRVQ